MAVYIRDEEIDRKIKDLAKKISKDFNIKNVSKADAIRFLLDMKKQGKKTDRKWKNLF